MKFITELPTPTVVSKENVALILSVLHLLIDKHKEQSTKMVVAVDFETFGFDRYHKLDDEPLWMGLCWEKESRYFVPRTLIHMFLALIEGNPNVMCVFHNFKFDVRIARNIGFSFSDIETIEDTMLMYHQIDSADVKKLDHCSLKFLGIPMGSYTDVVTTDYPEVITPGHEAFDKFVDYGSLDAWATYNLYFIFKDRLESMLLYEGHDKTVYDYYRRFEIAQVMALMDMEENGIFIDLNALNKVKSKHLEQQSLFARQLCQAAGEITDKPLSTKFLAKLLYETLKFPVLSRTGTGAPATDESSIVELKKVNPHPILDVILGMRNSQKIVSTYCEGVENCRGLRNNIVHTDFIAVGTRTGRLSSKQPNLQNQSPIAKTFYVPREGNVFLGADYSALELRILAHFSGDKNMIDAFTLDKDLHCVNAAQMNGMQYEKFYDLYKSGDSWAKEQRDAAKTIVYGLNYGAQARSTAGRLSNVLNREVQEEEAQDIIDRFFRGFPLIKSFQDSCISKAKKLGYAKTLCGSRRILHNIKSTDYKLRSSDMRKALNAPIQGSAADIVKAAMIRVWEDASYGVLKELNALLLLQIHDEFVLEVPIENLDPASERLKELMEDPFDGKKMKVPLTVAPNHAYSWAELK